ncbi:MAG: hypothetical protein PHS49_01630 [Candidatus Gracilibacteria bacterium]|nr:hypothetical protein [Candidatus Gracilibacteria bacterium]
MRTIYFFGYNLNGLEYVTYVIIPSSIVLVILVFIYFNLRLLRTSLNVSQDDKNKFLDILFEDDFYINSVKKSKNVNNVSIDMVNEDKFEEKSSDESN